MIFNFDEKLSRVSFKGVWTSKLLLKSQVKVFMFFQQCCKSTHFSIFFLLSSSFFLLVSRIWRKNEEELSAIIYLGLFILSLPRSVMFQKSRFIRGLLALDSNFAILDDRREAIKALNNRSL